MDKKKKILIIVSSVITILLIIAILAGVYIYNVTLTNSNNEKQSGYSKLVIAR